MLRPGLLLSPGRHLPDFVLGSGGRPEDLQGSLDRSFLGFYQAASISSSPPSQT